MNNNTFEDTFFFCFNLFVSHIFHSYLRFCLLSHFEIIICIVKLLLATATLEFGHQKQYPSLPNDLNTSLVFNSNCHVTCQSYHQNPPKTLVFKTIFTALCEYYCSYRLCF